jgi:hypothetical protein
MNIIFRRSATSLTAALVACGMFAPACVMAAGAGAASGNWWYKSDEGSSSVWFGTLSWAQKANINWSVSKFTADGVAQPTAPVPFSEPKFGNQKGPGFPTSLVFTGYNITGTGPLGSKVYSTGAGSSSAGAVFYGANWNVTVSGGGTYGVRADANDPWPMMASDFTGFTPDSTFSLYLPFSMNSGQLGSASLDSGYGYDVSYTTASGTLDLLNVQVDKTGVTVTPNSSLGSQLSFYQESSSTVSPAGMSTAPGTPLTTSQLTSLIDGDVSSAGTLMSPINLGIELDGLAIPTTLLADGSLASIGDDAFAFEDNVATVPEPSPLVLAALGLAGVLVGSRRVRRP